MSRKKPRHEISARIVGQPSDAALAAFARLLLARQKPGPARPPTSRRGPR